MTHLSGSSRTESLVFATWIIAPIVTLAAVALSATAAVAQAHAADQKLGLLQVESDDVHDSTFVPMFMQELRDVLADRDDIEAIDTRVSLTQLSLGQDCDTAQASCLLRIAHSLHVDSFMFGKLTHEGGVPVVMLRRYDSKRAAIRGSALASFGSSDVTPAAMRTEVKKLVKQLLGPPPTAAPPKLVNAVPIEPESNGPGLRKFAGYSLLGGAAISAGLAVFSFVQIDQAEHNSSFASYRIAVGQNNTGAKDVCDEANAGKRYGFGNDSFRSVKHSCSVGATFEILQYIFLGTAVVTGGLASFLLLGDSGERKDLVGPKHIRFRPSIARGGMSLTAAMRF
jgi:hypothetical protein